MKKLLFILFWTLTAQFALGQSFELMPGTERLFMDIQYLEPFSQGSRFSLFTRARATSTYDGEMTDVFAGAYGNYTTKLGVGGTVVGRISGTGAGVDVGVHFFKANKNWMVFALPAVQVSNDPLYSWFSIMRLTPSLSEKWRAYTSLELFSAFRSEGHLVSVQRIRLGVDRKGYQFGLGLNLRQFSRDNTDSNPGVFVRKQF